MYQMKNNNGNLLKNLNSIEKWCKFFLNTDNPAKQKYIDQLTSAEGNIMEAKKNT
jgi:hypothetical protein